jgi:phospholipase C
MVRYKILIFWGLLASAAGLLVLMNGCAGTSGNSNIHQNLGKIQHVVILFQENRTTDNLFHDPVLMSRGADIATTGVNSTGQTITLKSASLVTDYDFSHAHEAFVKMYDNGQMDGADLIAQHCSTGATDCPRANLNFEYVQASDVEPYFKLAETYTFGDKMFQTNQGPSFPAHQYIISGTSAVTETSNLLAAENPGGLAYADDTGCAAAASQTVYVIDSTNMDASTNETQKLYPCYEHNTLIDLLDAQKISWRYYGNVTKCDPNSAPCGHSGIWVGPNAIQHLCVPNAAPPNGTSCTGAEWVSNVLPNTQVLTDVQNGQLPAVSWVIPDGKASDHPNSNTGEGPSWVASVVNAIGNSQYWNNTAIIITWDDWGGLFDHVAPTVRNSYEYGFRVPLIVVSPYAKAAYISHNPHDFGSILKFVETVFGLGTIDTKAGGYADFRSDDLSDCFDFNQTPLVFTTVPTKYDANYFLSDKRPPVDPDDD